MQRLPEIPFGAGIALWGACAVAFSAAGEMHQAWAWLAWLPVGVVLVLAGGRKIALRRSRQREESRAVIEGAYAVTDEERERLARTGELDGLYSELNTADEIKVAVGSVTGVAPSEIRRFAVFVIDGDGRLNTATSCCPHEMHYLIHIAHYELTGGQ